MPEYVRGVRGTLWTPCNDRLVLLLSLAFVSGVAAFQYPNPTTAHLSVRTRTCRVMCADASPPRIANTPLRTRLRRTFPRPKSDLDKRIINVLLPCSLSFLVVPLTNAVDTAWIGRMGNALALAGQVEMDDVRRARFNEFTQYLVAE